MDIALAVLMQILLHIFRKKILIIMSLKIVIEQNNRTITCLKDQDFSSALESSSEALRLYHSALVHSSEEDECPPPSMTAHTDSDYLDQCLLQSEVVDDETEAKAHQPFIYRSAIPLPPSIITDSAAMVAPILIFNIALAYHLRADDDDGTTPGHQISLKGLHKARCLYEKAYEAHGIDQNVLFQFVILNNIAIIDQRMGNYAMMQSCFEHLTSLFMLLVDQGCSVRLRHIVGFLSNLSSAAQPASAAA
ncbi:unnamed protein product [Cylindrotheca closterium]|uniref:Uncharacterized protein n=1 Tax=Cylindrotheca closterium TaxID=2856 RepID=A0AAD2FGA0_9STRA|nr:unnamed protein product [Cylindrotheca closterium]